MAGRDRMTIEEVVGSCATSTAEAEVSELIGARQGTARGSGDASQRVPGAAVGHPGRSSCRSPSCGGGSYFPSSSEPRKRSEQTLVSVVQRAKAKSGRTV